MRSELRQLDQVPRNQQYRCRHLNVLPGVPKCVYTGFDMVQLAPMNTMCISLFFVVAISLTRDRGCILRLIRDLEQVFAGDIGVCYWSDEWRVCMSCGEYLVSRSSLRFAAYGYESIEN